MVGEQIRYQDFTATVQTLTHDGRPARVGFQFRCPLEDPSLSWLVYVAGHLQPFELPAVGETVTIEATMLRP